MIYKKGKKLSAKPKKPTNSALEQQRLAAWQPILTAGTVLPLFFVIGILFIPIGIGLLLLSDNVRDVSVDYTQCESGSVSMTAAAPNTSTTPTNATPTQVLCQDEIESPGVKTCQCKTITFEITKQFQGQVYMYYALTNFYQNHRRYVTSRDDLQLLGAMGDVDALEEPSSDCFPFQKVGDKFIYPCGATANSMFSDKINLSYVVPGGTGTGTVAVPVTNKGIAWKSDIKYKFKYPSWWSSFRSNPKLMDRFTKPPAWEKPIWDMEDGIKNEDFIVWMRISTFASFRKLYRIIEHEKDALFKEGLPAGNYTLDIAYSFPVKTFNGTKSVILATTSIMGGKNPFLGIAYVMVGGVCLVLGVLFLFIHINYNSRRHVSSSDSHSSISTVTSGSSEERPHEHHAHPFDPTHPQPMMLYQA